MRSFGREKKIYCGDKYREVDIFTYTETQKEVAERGKGKRSKKTKESLPKQKNLNDKNSKRALTQSAILNFGKGDYHETLTHSEENLPESEEEAGKIVERYLRRVRYRHEKFGLPFKYILITSTVSTDGSPARIHHHLIISSGLPREELEAMWTNERINWKRFYADQAYRESIKPIGFANVDRLQPNGFGLAGLANYIGRQGGKKRWSHSKNLKKVTSRANDHRYSLRQIEKLAKEKPGVEYWEKQYPGWTLSGKYHSVDYEYNPVTGWAIRLKLRRKEPEQEKT